MLRMASRISLFLISTVFLLCGAAFSGATKAAAETCPAGMHVAAPDEVPAVAAGTCTPDGVGRANILNGGCDMNPYPALERYRNGGNVHITPQSSGSNDLRAGINPVLACRLLKFFQYAEQTKGCQFKINSAYRSAQEQANVCPVAVSGKCGKPGLSCHQYGLAVDVDGSSQCMSWATSFLGTKNPSAPGAQQFKLHFPISMDLVHIQCLENYYGWCTPNTKPCDGSVTINPDLNYTPAQPSLSDQIRRALGMQPPPPPPPPPQQALPPQQPLPTQPTAHPQQTSLPNISPTSTSVTDIANTNSNDNTNTNAANTRKSTSTYDYIDQYANPVSDLIDIGHIVAIATPPGPGNVAALKPGSHESVAEATTVPIFEIGAPQTFTSSDLANSPVSTMESRSNGFLLRLLETMRNALLYALNYLRPFGAQLPEQSA